MRGNSSITGDSVWFIARFLLLVIVGAAVVLWILRSEPEPVAKQPATAPTTAPVVLTIPPPAPPLTYVGLIQEIDPKFPTTRPRDTPLSMSDAAQVVIPADAWVCSRGDLWIRHADAPAVEALLHESQKDQIHLTRDAVVFVDWRSDAEGALRATPVVSVEGGDCEVVTHSGRKRLSHRYDFARAQQLGDRSIVAPFENGVGVISFGESVVEAVHLLPPFDSSKPLGLVRLAVDRRGVLAWASPDARLGFAGSRGAIRILANGVEALDAGADWPESIIHLVPLLDGSVLQIVPGTEDTIDIRLQPPVDWNIDEAKINALVAQLSDLHPRKREAAQAELSRFGVSAWPVLEKLLDDQPPEARSRIELLLQNRIKPTLGGMTLVVQKMTIASQQSDGSIIFHAPAGVWVSNPLTLDRQVINPAWISIRPGRAIELLPPVFAKELDRAPRGVASFLDEWIISTQHDGPQRFMGNHFMPLLRKAHRAFDVFQAVDRRGRWVFKSSDLKLAGQTLLIDHTLDDPTPRLPVWSINVVGGSTGWVAEGWPARKRGGAWSLRGTEWATIDEAKTPMIESLPDQPADPDAPIFTSADGAQYFDGLKSIRLKKPDGTARDWPLPAKATGAGPVWLVEDRQGKLFLFNQPGRLLRLAARDDANESFKIEATFTRDIPNVAVRRMWIDPAGRLVLVHAANGLSICFPTGEVPQGIRKKCLHAR